jgi:hypothetical protein
MNEPKDLGHFEIEEVDLGDGRTVYTVLGTIARGNQGTANLAVHAADRANALALREALNAATFLDTDA